MANNNKTIDLSDVTLDPNRGSSSSSQSGELTGLDLGFEGINFHKSPPKNSDKGIDITQDQRVSSYLAGIDAQSNRLPKVNLTATVDLDTTEELGLQQSLPALGGCKSRNDADGKDFSDLESLQFGQHTDSGIGDIEEPSKIEHLKFPNFDGPTELTDEDSVHPAPAGRRNLLLLPVFIAALGIFYYSLGDTDLIGELLSGLGLDDSQQKIEEAELIDTKTPPAKSQNKANDFKNRLTKTSSSPTLSEVDFADIKNPYWPLPNRAPQKVSQGLAISPAQEEKWKFGLSHPFTYRRHITVQEIRNSHVVGSEALLFQALQQPKLWARMEALLGLVELGLQVDVDTISQALGDARPSLIKNYMKRMSVQEGDSKYYIYRQAIRIVDAATRLEILKILLDRLDEQHYLYFEAAKLDPSNQVQAWLSRSPIIQRLPDKYLVQYKSIVAAYLTGKGQLEDLPNTAVQELEVEELADSELVKEVSFFQDMLEKQKLPAKEAEKDDGFGDIQKANNTLME